MSILDLIDDTDDEKEFEQEIRTQIKLTIKVFEILYDELQKSNLPDEIKESIIKNF